MSEERPYTPEIDPFWLTAGYGAGSHLLWQNGDFAPDLDKSKLPKGLAAKAPRKATVGMGLLIIISMG